MIRFANIACQAIFRGQGSLRKNFNILQRGASGGWPRKDRDGEEVPASRRSSRTESRWDSRRSVPGIDPRIMLLSNEPTPRHYCRSWHFILNSRTAGFPQFELVFHLQCKDEFFFIFSFLLESSTTPQLRAILGLRSFLDAYYRLLLSPHRRASALVWLTSCTPFYHLLILTILKSSSFIKNARWQILFFQIHNLRKRKVICNNIDRSLVSGK